MGHSKKGRDVQGVLILNKPSGLTSNAALQVVKRLYGASKAGHTGSLDPLACGLLPICLGAATKVSTYLLDADKRYWVRAKLGQSTTTGDAEGELIESLPCREIDERRTETALLGLTGEIEQIPPMYSALKHQGQRLYKLAREGIEVERKPRRVRIHRLLLLRFDEPHNEIEFEAHCSKGTYIRTLAEQIGAALACGAHVTALRRTGVGPYGEDRMINLDTLRSLAKQGYEALDKRLLPIESALESWPEVRLSDDAAYYLRQGQAVLAPHAPTYGWVRLYSRRSGFLGVGEIMDDGKVAPRRLMQRR